MSSELHNSGKKLFAKCIFYVFSLKEHNQTSLIMSKIQKLTLIYHDFSSLQHLLSIHLEA